MMKKFLALLLAALMLTSVAFAEGVTLPEPASGFNMTVELPENMQITDQYLSDDFSMVEFDFTTEGMASYILCVAPTELYTGSMEEMDEATLTEIAQIAIGDMDAPTYTTTHLDNGMTVIVLEEKSEYPTVSLINVHDGYFVQLTVAHEDFSEVTADDFEFAMALMTNITFVEAIK